MSARCSRRDAHSPFDRRTERALDPSGNESVGGDETISIALAATIGAAAGAVALGAASAASGNIPGLAIALQHIPTTTHGHDVVSVVQSALVGGAAGGGIGAAVAAVAKSLAAKAAAVVH